MAEVKQRDYVCDLSKLGWREMKGVNIPGAACYTTTDSKNCLLEDCRPRYVEHAQSTRWKNAASAECGEWQGRPAALPGCGNGATTALAMSGEDNALEDCVIHDANYLGSGRGGLDLANSIAARVEHCTIFRAGRDTIQHHASKRIRPEYNRSATMATCSTMMRKRSTAWGTDGQGGIIAYNWVQYNPHCNGIYLDNFSSNFIVHHNVILELRRQCLPYQQRRAAPPDLQQHNQPMQQRLRNLLLSRCTSPR